MATVPRHRSTDPASSSDDSLVAGSTSRYTPFGSWRTEPTANLTDWGFTGHMHHNLGSGAEDIGLVYMAARWYAPTLGRFLSADTIVPNPANPQSYNRYSYVENRLLVFTDPTGHRPSDGCETESCMSDQHTWGQNFVAQMAQKDDRFHTAVTALYEDYQTRFGDVIDVPQGDSVEYTLWQIAYQDTLTLDRVIREGSWLTNAVRNAFNGGYLDPLDIIEGSIGVILATTIGSDSNERSAGIMPIPMSNINSYRVSEHAMMPHLTGSTISGKSQFLSSVDAHAAVLRAAEYADMNNLWVNNQAKVYITNGPVGVLGRSGELTTWLTVTRTDTGLIHGWPSSPP